MNQAGNTTYAGVIRDGTGTMTLVKTGTGTQTLHGINTYSGGTTISNGALVVNGSAGTGLVTVASFGTLGGTGTKTLLIRAVGPGLSQFGLTGVLADPTLQVFEGNTLVAANDNWSPALAGTFSSVGAFGLPSGSRDAAIVVSLRSGSSYTVIASGAR